MPEAGGSYAFLRRIYGGPGGKGQAGRFLAFLYVFQLSFSAPLSAASGCIGLSQYATYVFPSLGGHTAARMLHAGGFRAGIAVGPETGLAIAALLLVVLLLYRGLTDLRIVTAAMWCSVMALMTWIILTGVVRGHLSQAFAFPPGAFHLTPAFFLGLGSAMMFATYDYWGYYNITFLGGEVKDAARTVPRAILIAIALVAAIYLAMNISVLAVLPWQGLVGAQNGAAALSLDARRAVISTFMEAAYGPHLGPALGRVAAGLVMMTAFSGVFSLLLGYSRIPYAAARDGNYFRVFGKLHPKGFPNVSLLALGAAAICFCFFSLADVIAALVVLRILLQFLMQHAGVIYLRRTQPEMKRPFRIWLYPLPPLLAIAGFVYILIERAHFQREIAGAAVLIAMGTVIYLRREGIERSE
jgi:amino acid transporter